MDANGREWVLLFLVVGMWGVGILLFGSGINGVFWSLDYGSIVVGVIAFGGAFAAEFVG